MKIKGVERSSTYSVWVENKVNLEKYLARFLNRKTVDIMMWAKVGDEVKVYSCYCQNRKVASKVLNNIRNDLKGEYIVLTPRTGYEKFLEETWGYEVIITVYGNKFPNNHKAVNGVELPF